MNKSSSCSSVILKPQRFTESQTYRWNHRIVPLFISRHQHSCSCTVLRLPRSPSAKQSLHRQDIQCFHLTHGGFQKSMDWQIEGDTWKFHYKNLQPLICIGAFAINSYDALAVREVWSGADGGSRLDVCVCVHCKPVQWLSSVILYSD